MKLNSRSNMFAQNHTLLIDEPFSFLKLTSDKNQLKVILYKHILLKLWHETNYRKNFLKKISPKNYFQK